MSEVYTFIVPLLALLAINVILASSLNIINGFCGLFSLGHIGFFAVGAYAAAFFSKSVLPTLLPPGSMDPGLFFALNAEGVSELGPTWALGLSLVVGLLAAGLAGLIVGVPCLRLGGDYLAMATIGFAEIIRIVIVNLDAVGGARGYTDIPKYTNPINALVVCGIVLLVVRQFVKSSFGRCVISIREDEIAARSMGVDVRFYKVVAFVLGSGLAGVAGALFSHEMQFISPTSFTFLDSVMVLLMIVIGGLGSQRGAILGAIIVTLLPELLRFSPHLANVRMLIFGVILVLVMLFKPEGLMGFFKVAKKKNATVADASGAGAKA